MQSEGNPGSRLHQIWIEAGRFRRLHEPGSCIEPGVKVHFVHSVQAADAPGVKGVDGV